LAPSDFKPDAAGRQIRGRDGQVEFVPTEPIEYQRPLPEGYQLRYFIHENTVRISRDSPGRILLWLEAGAPLVLLIVVGAFVVLTWRWINLFRLPPHESEALGLAGCGAQLLLLALRSPRIWQNMGIVIEIAISQDTFYWRKRNVWGDKEFFWPLSSIRLISVENNLLKVFRFRGPSLSAFSFVKPGEREYARALLSAAILRHLHPKPLPADASS
jgi:hypothetical protein